MIPIFWGSFFMILFAYFGYPASLFLVGLFRGRKVCKGDFQPSVTMVITAYNEEKRIRAKLENSLRIEYPKAQLQVIVASDGSTDGTNAIVASFGENGIELLALPLRNGKEFAQREAVQIARGEILVFTDVATELEPGGLARIVANFADPAIGCVSSEDRLVGKDGKTSGEGFYVRYEMLLRRLETRVNSVVGLSGSFFAARKEVCTDFSPSLQSDFRTVLNSIRLGMRGVCDPKVVGYYRDVVEGKREFERKVRTVLRGITVFFGNLEFLNVFRYRFFSYQLFCHKFLRWTVPFFLLLVFVSNIAIAGSGSPIYVGAAIGQSVFYVLAVWGWFGESGNLLSFFRVPTYFLTVNISILVAWWRYVKGDRVVMWAPSER